MEKACRKYYNVSAFIQEARRWKVAVQYKAPKA
jgi:hypothetical protein